MHYIVVFTLVGFGLISAAFAKQIDVEAFLKTGSNGAEEKSNKPEPAKSAAKTVLVAMGVLMVLSVLAVAAVLGTVYYRRRKRGNQDIGSMDLGKKDKTIAGPGDEGAEGPADPVLDLRNYTESTGATPEQRGPGSFPQVEGSQPAAGGEVPNPNGPLLANEETNVKVPYLSTNKADHTEVDPTQLTTHLATGSELNQISAAPDPPNAGGRGKSKEGRFPLAFMQRIWNEVGRLTDFSVQDDGNMKRSTPTPVETKVPIEKRDSDLDVESQEFKTVAIYEKQNSKGFFKQIAKKVLPQQSNKSVSKYSVTVNSSNPSTVQPSLNENSLASTELTTADSSTLKTIISDKNVGFSQSNPQREEKSFENFRDSSTGSYSGTSALTQSETLTSGTGNSRAEDKSGMDMRTVRTDSGTGVLPDSGVDETQTLKNSETNRNRSSGTNTVASGAFPAGTGANVEELASAIQADSLSNQQRDADVQQNERSTEIRGAQRQSAGGYPSGSSYMSDQTHLSLTQWTQTSHNLDQFGADAEPKTLLLQTVQDFEPDPSTTSSPRMSRKGQSGTGTKNDSSMSIDKKDFEENGSSTTLSTSYSASTNSIRESIPRGASPLLNDTFQTAIGSRASSTDGDVDSDIMESGAVAHSRENLFTSLALLNLRKPRRAKPKIRGVSNPRTKSLSNPCLSTTPRDLSSSDDDDDEGHPLTSFDFTQSKVTPSAASSKRSGSPGLKTVTASSASKMSTGNQHSRSSSLSRTTTDAIWAKVLAVSNTSSSSQQSVNRSKRSSFSAGSEKGTGNTRKHRETPMVSQEFEKFSDSYHLLQSSSDKSSDEMEGSENIRTVVMKSSAAAAKTNNTDEDESTGSVSFVPPLKRSDDDLLLKTVMANEMPAEEQKAVIFPLSVAKMVQQYAGWSSENSGAKMEKLVKESQYQNLETVESDDLQPAPDRVKHSSHSRPSQINSVNPLGSSGRAKKEKSDKEGTEKNKKVLQKEFPTSEATFYQIANLGGFHGGSKPGED